MTHSSLVVSARGRLGPQPARQSPVSSPPPRGIDRADEGLGGPDSEEFRLAGTGGEATTASSGFQTVVEYNSPRDIRSLLVEVSVSAESNGQFRVAANGELFGPFNGATDFTLPGDDARLYASRVVVEHKSTDGTSTRTAGSIVVKEV